MILEMIGMTAEIGAVSGDDLFVQTCRCSNGLERGTRTVQTVCGTVDQRRVFRIENGFIVHLIVFQIIGGSSYHAQHAGSFRVQHYDCPAGNLFQPQLFGFGIPQAVKVVDKAVQNVLQFPLVIAVDSQLYGFSGFHRCFHIRGNHYTVFHGDLLDTVCTAERAFHGTFDTAFAHGVVQSVALGFQLFVFLRIDRSNRTDLVGHHIALCNGTKCFLDDVHAGERNTTFFQFCDYIQRHVFCQCKTIAEREAPQLHFIPDSGEDPLLFRRVAVINVVVRFQLVHAVVCGGIDVHFQIFFQLADGVFIVGECVRLGIGNRQGSAPLHAVFV